MSHGGIGFPDFCRLKAPGFFSPLHFPPLLNHSFRILHILLNLWWSALTAFLVLNHAFRMIFAGDSSIHSTKVGGLLRLFPRLFDTDALDI